RSRSPPDVARPRPSASRAADRVKPSMFLMPSSDRYVVVESDLGLSKLAAGGFTKRGATTDSFSDASALPGEALASSILERVVQPVWVIAEAGLIRFGNPS